jgi:branched-chain amino acid transport system substrate-binding protein
MKRNKKIFGMFFVLFLMGLLLSSQTSQTLAADEIRIAALTPLTGAGSPYGPGMQKSIALAVDEINKAGGVNGKKIQLFTEDTQTDPEAAVRAAKKLIEVNKVVAIIGTWSSGVTMAVAPLAINANVVLMNTSGAPELTTLSDKNLVFRTEASNVLYGMAFAKIALKRGYKTACTMAFNNPSGRGNTEEFAKRFKEAGGKVFESVVYNPNQTTYKAELSKVLAPKPDVIVMGSYLPDTTIILKEWYQTGQPMKWIGPAWAINDKLIEALGANVVEGAVGVVTVPDTNLPAYKTFEKKYKEMTGQDFVTNTYSGMVYDHTICLALAMVAAKSEDPTVFNPSIQTISGPPGAKVYSFEEGAKELKRGNKIDYDGVSSKIDFDAAGDVVPHFGVFEVRNGKRERVDTIVIGE